MNGVGWEPNPRLRRHHPPSGLCHFPDDVRRHHPGADHRCDRRAHALPGPDALHAAVAAGCLLSAGSYGLGQGRPDQLASARSTLPAATSSTSPRVFRPWFSASMLGKRQNHGKVKMTRTTCRLSCSAPDCLFFGWFGFNCRQRSGCQRPGRSCLYDHQHRGCRSHAVLDAGGNDRHAKSRPRLARRPAWSSVWSPSRRAPASCRSGRRSSSAWWSARSAGSAISFLKAKLGYDDALDAFGCHGIGGIWGGIATGLFAQTSINPVAKFNGLVFGETGLIIAQLEAIGMTIVLVGCRNLCYRQAGQPGYASCGSRPVKKPDGLDGLAARRISIPVLLMAWTDYRTE